MSSMETLISSAISLAKEMTDVVSIIDRNLASAEKIRERKRTKLLIRALSEIIRNLYSVVTMNTRSIVIISNIILDHPEFKSLRNNSTSLKSGPINSVYLSKKFGDNFDESYFKSFTSCLIELRSVMRKYRKTIIEDDYTVLRNLDQVLESRIIILRRILEIKKGEMRVEIGTKLYNDYANLVIELDYIMRDLKDTIDNKRKDITKTK